MITMFYLKQRGIPQLDGQPANSNLPMAGYGRGEV